MIYTSAAVGALQTFSRAITPAGQIVGYYYDADGRQHGFPRERNGTISTFDGFPGAYYTEARAINPAGLIIGVYWIYDDPIAHGFLRATDGTITTVDAAPGASTAPAFITPGGLIVGNYSVDGYSLHGFLRSMDGTITTFDGAPGSQ